MGPITIDHGPSEERILRLGHPFGETDARILAAAQVFDFAVERARHGGLVRAGILDGAGAAVEHDLALLILILDRGPRRGNDLAAYLGEVRREAPIIVLAPLLVRMMMALSAGHADAEEQLTRIIDELFRLGQIAIPDGRRRFRLVAGRGEDVAHELVVRLVLGDGVADPGMEGEGAGRAVGLVVGASLHAENVGPAIREVVAVFVRIDQRVDQLVALGRVLVFEERLDLRRRRQGAGDVDIDAANENLVAGEIGRHETKLAPFLLRELIDHRLGGERVGRRLPAERDRGAERGDLSLIAGHDRRLAAQIERTHQRGSINNRDVRIVALVLGTSRDVDDGAVGVVSQDRELLAILPGDDPLFGKHGDLGDGRILVGAERRAGGDPTANEFVFVGAEFHPFAAGVSDLAGRLRQQET